MARRMRSAILIAVSLVVMTATAALAAITWTPSLSSAPAKVGPNYTWNYGNGLESTSTYVETLWASDCIKPTNSCSTWASDTGPYQGVYFQRSPIAGTPSWSSPKRLNPGTQHAERTAIAAAGDAVYAAWTSQTSYDHYDASKPRQLFVRPSNDQGATWGTTVALSPKSGRVDYPIIAASGDNVFAIWTDANTGNVKLRISNDKGVTWNAMTTIGTTTSGTSSAGEGFYGFPTIAASGTNVVASWFTDVAGAQAIAVSNNSGTSFTTTTLTAASPNDTIRYASAGGANDGVSNRVAVAYTDATAVKVAVYSGSGAPVIHTVAALPLVLGGKTYTGSYGPVVQPVGTSGLIVAMPACIDTSLANDCNYNSKLDRTDMLETDSANGGTSWSTPVVLGSSSTKGSPINDSPSIVTTSSSASYVEWNGWQANYFNYRLFLRQGAGTP